MPTVARVGPYRLYFFSHEPYEPPHVHVDRDDCTAKLWLEPEVAIARSIGFPARELRRVYEIVAERRAALLDAWHGHFGTAGR